MNGLGSAPPLTLKCSTGNVQRGAFAADWSVIGWFERTIAVDEEAKILYPSCHNEGS